MVTCRILAREIFVWILCSDPSCHIACISNARVITLFSGNEDYVLLYDGSTICADQFNDDSAHVACADLGYLGGAAQWRASPLPYSSHIPSGQLSFTCTGRNMDMCERARNTCESGQHVYITCQHDIKDNKGIQQWKIKREGESLAVKILMAACLVLVFLLIKKNSQMDKKDVQIHEFAKNNNKLIAEIKSLQMMINNLEPKQVLLSDVD